MADNIPEGKVPPELSGITVMLYTLAGRWYLSITAILRTDEGGRASDWHANFRIVLPFKRPTETYHELLQELGQRVMDVGWQIPESVVQER